MIKEASFVTISCLNERQAGEDRTQGEEDPYSHVFGAPTESTIVHETRCSSPSNMSIKVTTNGASCDNPTSVHIKPEAPDDKMQNPKDMSSDVHISSSPGSSAQSSISLPPKNSVNTTNSKEFKLNPGAKKFSPSCTNPRSAPPAVPTVANVAYVPHCPTMVPVATSQPTIEIGPFASRSSTPTKFTQYNNVVVGNNDAFSQFFQPVTGHAGARQQSFRFSGQYHPVQTVPTYLVPNSPVMVGRLGQLMYAHPVSQDAIQGIPSLPQVSPRPLLTPYQTNLPMLQGSATQGLQLCMTPPLFTGGQQPLVVPRPITFSNPLSTIQAIPVPGGCTMNLESGSKQM